MIQRTRSPKTARRAPAAIDAGKPQPKNAPAPLSGAGVATLLGVVETRTQTSGSSNASPWRPDGRPACGGRSGGARSWRGARERSHASRRGREPSCCGSTWSGEPCGAPGASSCCDACCAWQRCDAWQPCEPCGAWQPCGASPSGDASQLCGASPTWCAWRQRDDAPAWRGGSSCGPSSSHERYVASAPASSRYATAMCVTSSTS